MQIFENYIGDNTRDIITELQYQMYSYTISFMFQKIKKTYLHNEYASLYIESEKLNFLKHISSFDHRLMQIPHDCFAAVFRYRYFKGAFNREIFELQEDDIITYHNSLFIDIKFLNHINKNYWYLTKRWLEFIQFELDNHLLISREIAYAVLEFNLNESTNDNAWNSSYKARNLIKSIYNEIPWII